MYLAINQRMKQVEFGMESDIPKVTVKDTYYEHLGYAISIYCTKMLPFLTQSYPSIDSSSLTLKTHDTNSNSRLTLTMIVVFANS